jgi:hypothetical protein
VNVQMIDGLSAVGSGINHRAIAGVELFASDLSCNAYELGDQFRRRAIGELREICNMIDRHYQRVLRSLRVDVREHDDVIIPPQKDAWNLAADDPAKEASWFRHAHLVLM